jgi:hypothetical protein
MIGELKKSYLRWVCFDSGSAIDVLVRNTFFFSFSHSDYQKPAYAGRCRIICYMGQRESENLLNFFPYLI